MNFAGQPTDAFRLLGPRGTVRLKAVPMLDKTGLATVVRLSTASLADGRYRLIVDGDRIVDRSEVAINGDGLAGGDAVEAFFRRYSDRDGDEYVDRIDRFAFQSTWSRRSEDAAFLPYLDFDPDGQIDRHDVQQFRQRLGRSK